MLVLADPRGPAELGPAHLLALCQVAVYLFHASVLDRLDVVHRFDARAVSATAPQPVRPHLI